MWLFGGVAICGVTGSMAQAAAETLSLVVPSAAQLAPGGETALSIQIVPAAAIPRHAIVLIRGMPSSVTLSGGRLFESGVWGIPAADIGKVKITSVPEAFGWSDVTISVVTIDGTLLAEARTNLVIMAEAPADNPRPEDNTLFTATSPQDRLATPPADSARRLPSEQSGPLFGIVKKGDEQMASGNVSAARLLYQHAAENGLAAAALALAASYDEQELRVRRVLGGVQPDAKQAQFWYEKAHELGSTQALQQLQRFGAR